MDIESITEEARKKMREAYEEMRKWPEGPPSMTIHLTAEGPEIVTNMPKGVIILMMNCTMLGLAEDAIKIIHPN